MFEVITQNGKELSKLEIRKLIFDLQKEIQKLIVDQPHLDIKDSIEYEHSFIPGAYCRLMRVKANSLLVGRTHKVDCFNVVLTGKVAVITEEGKKIVSAPASFVSKAGLKKAGVVLEDLTWLCVFSTDETDIDKIEDIISEKDEDYNG